MARETIVQQNLLIYWELSIVSYYCSPPLFLSRTLRRTAPSSSILSLYYDQEQNRQIVSWFFALLIDIRIHKSLSKGGSGPQDSAIGQVSRLSVFKQIIIFTTETKRKGSKTLCTLCFDNVSTIINVIRQFNDLKPYVCMYVCIQIYAWPHSQFDLPHD